MKVKVTWKDGALRVAMQRSSRDGWVIGPYTIEKMDSTRRSVWWLADGPGLSGWAREHDSYADANESVAAQIIKNLNVTGRPFTCEVSE